MPDKSAAGLGVSAGLPPSAFDKPLGAPAEGEGEVVGDLGDEEEDWGLGAGGDGLPEGGEVVGLGSGLRVGGDWTATGDGLGLLRGLGLGLGEAWVGGGDTEAGLGLVGDGLLTGEGDGLAGVGDGEAVGLDGGGDATAGDEGGEVVVGGGGEGAVVAGGGLGAVVVVGGDGDGLAVPVVAGEVIVGDDGVVLVPVFAGEEGVVGLEPGAGEAGVVVCCSFRVTCAVCWDSSKDWAGSWQGSCRLNAMLSICWAPSLQVLNSCSCMEV